MEVDLITRVEEGEWVYYSRLGQGGREQAQAKCELNTGRWYCASHRQGFANQFQKDIHIHSGKHRLVWVCFEHGVEVP